MEPLNADWAERLLPNNSGGNIYRASKFPWNGNLDYMGTNPFTYSYAGYSKTSNQGENDWSDLMQLTYALNQVGPDVDYLAAIATNVNVRLWMRYFALCTLINYNETSMCNGVGDDYAMYRGIADRRFMLLAHDFDTILGEGDGDRDPLVSRTIWRPVDEPRSWATDQHANYLPRFLRHPAFAPIYLDEIKRLCDTVLAPEQFNSMLDQLQGGWVANPTLNSMKNFIAGRRAYVYSVLPLAFGAGTSLSLSNGYSYTTAASVSVTGMVNAIDTRILRINGVNVSSNNWSVWQGRFTNNVSLQPGLNNLLVQALDSNDVVIAATNLLVWCGSSAGVTVGGTLSGATVWSAANGPYNVNSSLTVPAGVTLTIQPGTTIYLGAGVNITVNSGGRLLADGTETQRTRFTRAPGATTTWGGITINGGAGSPETRIAYAHIEFNGATAIHSLGGTVFLDHLTFGATGRQYLSLDNSSFLVSDCVFPTATAAFELVHGSGIKSGGRGIFLRNFFGAANGYNDVVDFSGGQRPSPIVQFINNVFVGSGDDHLDLDSTDAWIEGNIFLHAHKNGSPDTSSAISGGNDTGEPSEITIIGNLIYDCDHAALAKQGNFFTFLNNTIVRQTHQGGLDTEGAVICLADNNMSEGAGAYFEGNIIYDAEALTRDLTNALVTFTNNVIYSLASPPWTGAGGGNLNGDPLFKYLPQLSETTNFTSWTQAQVMRGWFCLKTASPARGVGPNGLDLGGLIPLGASLAGEPTGASSLTNLTLTVGINHTGNGIPISGWPEGVGYTHYMWRLDGSPWSAELPISTPLSLTGLAPGTHRVEVTGKRDCGFYQDDAVYGVDASLTASRTWTVVPGVISLRINEILASNNGALIHEGSTPDAIELLNTSEGPLDLYGLTLTDDPQNPAKFKFPYGRTLAAGTHLVLYANDPDGTSGLHIGFNLAREGGGLYLFDGNGLLVDSVTYGPQLADWSVGRLSDGTWALTVPTFGAINRAAEVGDPRALRLNEWLAAGEGVLADDFVELFNPTPLPVALGGLYLTDNPVGWPNRHAIAALSFLPAFAYQVFYADGQPEQGALHLNFRLAAEQGMLGLFDQALKPIDIIWYGGHQSGITEGRVPNGATSITLLSTPTPGAANPLSVVIVGPGVVINEIMANNASFTNSDGAITDWVELYNSTNVPINLSDMSLSDNTLDPRRWVFPAGITLATGAYLRVVFNPDAPASTNAGLLLNTGFGLKASGDGVYLFDKTVNSNLPLNWITFGVQPADFTLGRVPNGTGSWTLNIPTPEAGNIAAALGNPSSLKINEWLADNNSGADWFEIWNSGAQPVALGGLYLTDDLNDRSKHEIPALSFIGASTNGYLKFVADGDTTAGADHVGFALKAVGEAIGLFTGGGGLIDGVAFTNQPPDVSEGRFPDGSPNIVSFPDTSSPGDPNYRLLTNVVVNEVLSHSEPPLFEDAIELYNTTAAPVDVSGWYLSDAKGMLQKFRIPDGTVIPARSFVVFYEYQLNPNPEDAASFALNGQGDQVYLSKADSNGLTGYHNSVSFGAAEPGVSFGRYRTSDGREEFVAMDARTFGMDEPNLVGQFRTGIGAPNAYPKLGPIIISEIMYRPPDFVTGDNVLHEFIELHNQSAAPAALFDPAYPTNTWRLRKAVDFDFPTNTFLPPDGYLLVVSFDPVADPMALSNFCAHYHLSANTAIFGPYQGKLDNSDESIELKKPDTPMTNDVPYVLVERVHYYDLAPWPERADGAGASLQRISTSAFGNDPINWAAGTPSPGGPAPLADSDGDGLPDLWEIANGLDRFNPLDVNLDSDGDGLSNWQEFQSGTNPRDLASALRLELVPVSISGSNALITFTALAHRPYTVEHMDILSSNLWQPFWSIESSPTNRQLLLPISPLIPQRYFRLRTP